MSSNHDLAIRLSAARAKHQAGHLDEAEAEYRLLLKLQPDLHAARFYLGTCLLQQDERKDEGADILEPLLALRPVSNSLLSNLGLYHHVGKRYSQADTLFRQALADNPASADLHSKLAANCLVQKHEQEAVFHFQAAVSGDPSMRAVYPMLVAALRSLGRFVEAYLWAERWLWVEPDSQTAKAEQGLSLARASFYAAAEQLIHPLPDDKADLLFYRAYLRQYQLDFQEAINLYRRAIYLDPTNSYTHFNLSLILLALGQLELGWREFDYRFGEHAAIVPHGHPEPEWDGRELHGVGILVHSEQGVGDVIQFMRFFPQIQARGGKVIFASYPDILTLLKAHDDAEIIQQVETVDLSYQWQIPLLSLGKIFARRTEDIPTPIPYLNAPPIKVDLWKQRFAVDQGFKVGLVWAGNPSHTNDHNRSSTLNDFAALAEVAGVTYYALQKGPTARQADCPPRDMWLRALDAEIVDFTDTAAIVANLDLVICVDTSVAHLAGAMGKPVWLALPDVRDWRWIEDRDDSPWYPSIRIFRRQQYEQWTSVFERIAAALTSMLVSRTDLPLAVQYEIAAASLARAGEVVAAESDFSAAIAIGGVRGRILRHAAYCLGDKLQALPIWLNCDETPSAPRLMLPPQEPVTEAIKHLDALWQTRPDDMGLGLILLQKLREAEQLDAAALLATQILNKHPHRWDVRYELAQCQKLTNKLTEAEANFQFILQISPRYPEAGINRAMTLDRLAKPVEAIQQMQSTAMCNPYHPLVRRFLAILLIQQRHYELALLVIAEHRKHFPQDSVSQFWHASALRQLGQNSEALALLDTLPSDYGEPFSVAQEMAFCRLALYPECSVSLIRELMLNAPKEQQPQYEYNLGLQLLMDGDMVDGWAYCEGRRRVTGSDVFEQQFRSNLPAWTGEPLADRRLLIFSEQGFGDTLHFLRYLNCIVGTCIIIYQDGLDQLLAETFTRPNTLLISRNSYRAAPVAADCYANLLSLPHLLQLPEPLYSSAYLALPFSENPKASHFADEMRRKIGIVWAGNPKHPGDRWRSISLRKLLLPLLELPGIAWYSLQKDLAANEALLLPAGTPWLNAAALADTFYDTAQVLDQLDLIITVDTSTAHLAGALGRQVWLLLPAQCDWRWRRKGERTPWYPTMRIFRQSEQGDWAPVISALENALRELGHAT